MKIELYNRTADTVITYFRATCDPEVRKYIPQKALTESEALADFEKTQQPGATSYGRTIYVDGNYIGDVWCYCIQPDEPNAMVSYCIFDKAYWGKGVATEAVRLFLMEIIKRFSISSLGAFTFSENMASIRVLQKNGFEILELFVEDGIESVYLQRDRISQIRQAEAESHIETYTNHTLFSAGSWLAKPVKTVLDLLPMFGEYTDFRALDLGCGVGRNSIPVAQHFKDIPCRVDCIDILEMAIEKLNENAQQYGIAVNIQGMVSSIDDYEIEADGYDLIMAISALEHIASRSAFEKKLVEIRKGLRTGGAACLIVNSGVIEHDRATSEELLPQFEMNLPTSQMQDLLEKTFAGWQIIKHTVVHQKYDIPRENGLAELETDVVTYVVRRNT